MTSPSCASTAGASGYSRQGLAAAHNHTRYHSPCPSRHHHAAGTSICGVWVSGISVLGFESWKNVHSNTLCRLAHLLQLERADTAGRALQHRRHPRCSSDAPPMLANFAFGPRIVELESQSVGISNSAVAFNLRTAFYLGCGTSGSLFQRNTTRHSAVMIAD